MLVCQRVNLHFPMVFSYGFPIKTSIWVPGFCHELIPIGPCAKTSLNRTGRSCASAWDHKTRLFGGHPFLDQWPFTGHVMDTS